MQIKKVMSLKMKSQYFSPVIFKDGNWIFYNEKNKCYFQYGDVKFTVPIKKSYLCIFIDNNAFVVNEEGSIYKIDLNTKKSSCIVSQLGADTLIYKTFDNKLFISARKEPFYRTGYFFNNDKLEQVKNVPVYCREIYEYKGDIYFLLTWKKFTYLFKRQNNSEDLICCFESKDCNNTIDLDFDFENLRVAYYDNVKKYIKVFDYSENLISKLKFRKTVYRFGLINNGKYLITVAKKQILIMDSATLTVLETVTFNDDVCFIYPSVDFNYADNSFCVSLKNEVILYEIYD